MHLARRLSQIASTRARAGAFVGAVLNTRNFSSKASTSSLADARAAVRLVHERRSLELDVHGERLSFHYVWLRDNCLSAASRDPYSGQKKVNAYDFPADLAPVSVALENAGGQSSDAVRLAWPDGHHSVYTVEWLFAHRCTRAGMDARRAAEAPRVLWTQETLPALPRFDYAGYMSSTDALRDAVDALHHVGVVLLTGVPVDIVPGPQGEDGTVVAQVARRLGVLQETIYGRTFDVKSEVMARNVAYTPVALPPHTDLCYLEAPPGVQLLHALRTDATGGANYFVDAFRIERELAAAYPDEHEVLSRVPLTFHYTVGGHRLRFYRPLLMRDERNDFAGVNWSPPFEGPLTECADVDMDLFYRAYARFAAMAADPAAAVEHRLSAGELVMFLNRRVLHARRAFDPTTGARLLRGTYVPLSDFKSRWRSLCQTRA